VKAVLLSSLYLFGGCAAIFAQPLSVYSDLAQIDGLGKVTAPETPREILSPALVRNGFNSFQVVVEVPDEAKWWLFVGQNPENAVKVTLYREMAGSLEPVELPYQSSGTQVLWMDLWADGNAPIRRIKVEPELNLNDDWVTYPIEGRVVEARVPLGPPFSPAVLRQDPTVLMRGGVCGSISGNFSNVSGPGPSLESLRFRNVQQDLRLVDAHPAAKDDVKKLLGGCDAPLPSDPESYLRIRDYLFRLR
jgi:hypothetical protein